jgi:hypothetical protein
MNTISSWKALAAELGNHASSTRPLKALEEAGIVLAPRLRQAIAEKTGRRPYDEAAFQRLLAREGPLPQITVSIGETFPELVALGSQFGAALTLDARVLNDVARAFFDARAYPQEIVASIIRKLLSIALLRQFCSGVPEVPDAAIGPMKLRGPVSFEVLQDGERIRARQSIRLEVTGSQPSSLDGILSLDILLALEASGRIRLAARAVESLNLTLAVDATSPITPRSPSDQAQLEQILSDTLRERLNVARILYTLPVSQALTGRFSNTIIEAADAGGFAQTGGGRPIVTLGVNLRPTTTPSDPATLVATAPPAPNTASIVVDQGFAGKILGAAIASGDLERFVNAKISSAVDPLSPAPVKLRSGSVRFTPGKVTLRIDGTWVDACAFGKDLKFASTTTMKLVLADGKIQATDIRVDINLDNTDAILCTILSALLGPFGLIMNTIVLSIVAAINPTPDDKSRPSFLEPALPGTEKRLSMALTSVEVQEGRVVALGKAEVIDNIQDSFVYIQVIEVANALTPRLGLSQFARRGPLSNARVAVFELDNPPPAGDDVAIPDTEPTERFVGNKFIISEIPSYAPRADEFLGEATTDADGLVRLRVHPNTLGGIFTRTVIREDLHTGQILSQSTTRRSVAERAPDFAVTITDADGTVLTSRRLILANATGRHAGTLNDPIIVEIPGRIEFERIPRVLRGLPSS